MKVRLGLLALAAALAGGCGSATGNGKATLWVTRDRGAHVLVVRKVPAGLTAMQALSREVKLKTRYGGRYVQAIDGIEGSLTGRRDWFYFVNGIQADRSAAEYRLRPGDVEWWDYRSWVGKPEFPVTAAAFPSAFLHGFDGKVRPTAVRYTFGNREVARGIGRVVRAKSVAADGVRVPAGANGVMIFGGETNSTFLYASNHADPHGPVTIEMSAGAARRLVRNPQLARFRFVHLP